MDVELADRNKCTGLEIAAISNRGELHPLAVNLSPDKLIEH